MQDIPKSLQWRGETIWLRGVTELLAADNKPYTRYEYGIENEPKAYFYDFGRGIDWEAEQSGNTEPLPKVAPKQDRVYAMTKGAIYARNWKERNKAGLTGTKEARYQRGAKRVRLQETPKEAKPDYDEFREWIEKGMK